MSSKQQGGDSGKEGDMARVKEIVGWLAQGARGAM